MSVSACAGAGVRARGAHVLLQSISSCRCLGTARVILLEDVDKVGYRGEEVAVRGGHMRNYMFPKGLAVYATEDNRAKFRAEEKPEDLAKIEALKQLARTRRSLQAAQVSFKRHSPDKKTLHGEVTAENISSFLREKRQLDVPAARISLPGGAPLKSLGDHKVLVALDLPEALAASVGDNAPPARGRGGEGGGREGAAQPEHHAEISVKVIKR